MNDRVLEAEAMVVVMEERATEAQIEAARECLKGMADQTAQATRWFGW